VIVLITREFRQILAELEMISHGTTAKIGYTTAHGNDRELPPGESNPPHLRYRALWDQQITPEGKDKVLRAAKHELDTLRRRPTVNVTGEPAHIRHARIVKFIRDGWTHREIAVAERTSEGEVRRIWAKSQKKGEAESVRAMAERTGLSKSRVHRMFRDHAA
jgi:hypothetical protein